MPATLSGEFETLNMLACKVVEAMLHIFTRALAVRVLISYTREPGTFEKYPGVLPAPLSDTGDLI